MLTDFDRTLIDEMISFWFAEETKARWWQSTPAFDDHCRRKLGDLAAKAANGELTSWETTADGALALCLLLDQMPRNIHRGTPKAFATDAAAVAVASRAIERGLDRALDPEQRKFLYMPFMHSEILADQERSIALCEMLNDDTVHHAKEHADVISRFGRFPHRNAILGRDSTPEENAFLDAGAKTYGQPQPDDD